MESESDHIVLVERLQWIHSIYGGFYVLKRAIQDSPDLSDGTHANFIFL